MKVLRSTFGAFSGLIFLVAFGIASAQTTNPSRPDSDHDGFFDGPDVWIAGVWHLGEDKNGNGRFDPYGPDRLPLELDVNNEPSWLYDKDMIRTEPDLDETNPNDPRSRPPGPNRIVDTDRDGLSDEEEDSNRNGEYDPETDASDLFDQDTDDDGLSDFAEEPGEAFAVGWVPYSLRDPHMTPFPWSTSNEHPDSDDDGLPDGLELGVTQPIAGFEYQRAGQTIVIKGTDTDATFVWKDSEGTEHVRKCFIADLDPKSISNPRFEDTNEDGVLDGVSDANANGRMDEGEHDPGAGIVRDGFWRFVDPPTWSVRPVIREGSAEPSFPCYERIIIRTTTDAPPEVLIGDPLAVRIRPVDGIRQIRDRIWLVVLEWVAARPEFEVEVIFAPSSAPVPPPPGMPVSVSFHLTTLPPVAISNPNQSCQDMRIPNESSDPQPWRYRAADISWSCVTPLPSPGNFWMPDTSAVPLALNVALIGSYQSRLALLRDRYWNGFLGGNLPDSGESPLPDEILERQYLFGLIYSEVGWDLMNSGHAMRVWNLVLMGIVPQSRMTYTYALPWGPNQHIATYTRYDFEGGKKPYKLKTLRLFETINVGFAPVAYAKIGGGVPVPIGSGEDWKRFGKGKPAKPYNWFDVMTPRSYVDAGGRRVWLNGYQTRALDDGVFEVPFRLKTWAEMESRSPDLIVEEKVTTEQWKVNGSVKNVRVAEQDYSLLSPDFVKVVLQCAVATEMCIHGLAGAGFLTDRTPMPGLTLAGQLSNRFDASSSSPSGHAHHPVYRNATYDEDYPSLIQTKTWESDTIINGGEYYFRYSRGQPVGNSGTAAADEQYDKLR